MLETVRGQHTRLLYGVYQVHAGRDTPLKKARVSCRTCISSILPAGPSQGRASAALPPPSLQENQGDFLSFLRLSWDVPPWAPSVSSWLFRTFSSSSWGFGAHVQHHQVFSVPGGRHGEGPEGGARASRRNRCRGAIQGHKHQAHALGVSTATQTLGALTMRGQLL